YGWKLNVMPDVTTTYIAEVTGQRLCYFPASRCAQPQGQLWANPKSRPFTVRIRRLAATAYATAGTSLHWTWKAAPGYQHLYRTRGGSSSALCRKRSALLIRCVDLTTRTGDQRLANDSILVRLLSRTRVQYVFRYIAIDRKVEHNTAPIPNKSWAA